MSYQDLQHIEDKHSAVIVTVVLRVLDDMTVYVFINGEKLPDSAFRWALTHSNGKLKYWSQLDNILNRYFTGVAYLSRVTTSKMISKSSPKKRQPARGWNAAEICTNCVYTFPAPSDGGPILIFGQAGRCSLSPGWLCSSQKRGTSSQILARPHTQKNTLQSIGFVTSVTNKYTRNKPQSDVTTHTTHTGFI